MIWKLHGFAWFAIIIPILGYTAIAESLALGWLYFAILGFVGGTVPLVVAALIAIFHRRLRTLIQHSVVKSFDTNRKLVAYEALICSCALLTVALLHLPLSPLWYGLVSLSANSWLEGRWGVSLEEAEEPREDGKPNVVPESLFNLWLVTTFFLVFICWFSGNNVLEIPLLISVGLLYGSFLEAMRKYILQVYAE